MRADINSKLIKAVSDFGTSSKKIERLLMDGANPNATDKEGKTALMHAVSPWGKIDAVNPLIAAGADVNAADNNGKTALMHAVSDSYIPAVELLIAAGADTNARDNDGKTALMHVKIPVLIDQSSDNSGARAAQGLAEMNIKLLLEAGADVNATDNDRKTALALAQESGQEEVAALLHAAGAKDFCSHSTNHTERKHTMSGQVTLTKDQLLVLQVSALKQTAVATNIARSVAPLVAVLAAKALDPTARAINCLKAANLYYIGDVIQLTEDELRQIPNLSSEAAKGIKEKLESFGLSLGTKLENWPPAGLPYPPEGE